MFVFRSLVGLDPTNASFIYDTCALNARKNADRIVFFWKCLQKSSLRIRLAKCTLLVGANSEECLFQSPIEAL